ncbi:MAG: hypothetical protein V4441_06695 [Pseudomonadota bacterium]
MLRLRRVVVGAVFDAGDQGREQDFQSLRREYLLFHFTEDQIVEVGHRNAAAPASRLTFVHGVVARIITVAPAFAGAQGHAAPTSGALGNSGQQRRPVEDARRHPRWPPRLKRALHSLENMRLDDDGRLEFNPLAAFLELAGPPFMAIEVITSGVCFARQDFMHAGRSELPPAMGDVLPVEFMRDNAHAFPGAVHIEHHAHDRGFRWLHSKLLLDGIGACFDHDRLVAKGRLGAVPKSLPGILFHGAQDVLRVLAALIFIEHGAELAEHLPARIVGDGLRNRDQRDVVLLQRAPV